MPTAFIGSGSPTSLTMPGACTVDGSNIGLLAFVAVVPLTSVSHDTFTSRTLTYGPSNTPAVSCGAIDTPGNNGWVEVFFLQGIEFGAGATSKVVAAMSSAVKSIGIQTITYTNTSQVTPGSFTANSFTGTSCSLSVASAPGKFVVAGFACAAAITGASSGNQRLLANNGTSGNAQNASVIDIAGANVSTITATTGSSHAWAAVAVSIDFIVAASADHQTLVDHTYNAFRGPTSESSAVDVTLIHTEVSKQFYNISSIQNNLLGFNSAFGLLNDVIAFASYPNGSMPAGFTTVTYDPDGNVTGNATIGIDNGLCVYMDGSTTPAWTGQLAIWGTPTITDYQSISGIWSGQPKPSGGGGAGNTLAGRLNSTGTSGIFWRFDELSSDWRLQYLKSGSYYTIALGVSPSLFTFKSAAIYTLNLGTSNGVDKAEILENGIPLADQFGATEFDINQFGPGSVIGSSNRLAGPAVIGYTQPGGAAFGYTLPMSTFATSDNFNVIPVPPTPALSVIGEIPSGTKNGVNITFTTAHSFQAGTTGVYRNGLREMLGVGYTETIPVTISFTTAPHSDDDIIVDYVLL